MYEVSTGLFIQTINHAFVFQGCFVIRRPFEEENVSNTDSFLTIYKWGAIPSLNQEEEEKAEMSEFNLNHILWKCKQSFGRLKQNFTFRLPLLDLLGALSRNFTQA